VGGIAVALDQLARAPQLGDVRDSAQQRLAAVAPAQRP
jgi:hypothetical protein